MYKFIIVDDEAIIVDNFEYITDWSEIDYCFAGGFLYATAALEYLKIHNDISLIITDISMTDMSGLQFTEQVRKLYPHIAVIFLSGYKSFEYAKEAVRLKAIDYLVKPLDIDQLKQTMDMAKSWFADYHSSPSEYTNIIELVKKYVRENISKKITSEMVANAVNTSPGYIGKYFKRKTGINLVDYITDEKISKTIELLKDPTIRINEICYMVGYNSMHHFLSLFRDRTGLTPTEYRKKMQENTQKK
ncbi:MAG: response regulator [Clostridia bacterium]|nr:response regulator [Clostridia bacterium]